MTDKITQKLIFHKSYETSVRDYLILRKRSVDKSLETVAQEIRDLGFPCTYQTVKNVWDRNLPRERGDNK